MGVRKEQYVYVQSERRLCRINLSDLESEKQPSIETVVDFLKEGLPIEMGPIVFDDRSKLCFVGGEKLKKGVDILYRIGDGCLDVSHGKDGLNEDVFVLDLASNSNSKCIQAPDVNINIPFGKMNGPKTNPNVYTIAGKIYVLASNPCFYNYLSKKHPSPTFEVFDRAVGSWKVLPDPPFYAFRDDMRLEGFYTVFHLVIGCRLFLHTGAGIFCYDAETEKWESSYGRRLLEELYCHSAPFPTAATKAMAEYKGVFVAYAADVLVAYNVASDGQLRSYRVLDELKNLYDAPFSVSSGFVIHLGEGKMCLVLSGLPGGISSWTLRISTFQVYPRITDSSFLLSAVKLKSCDFQIEWLSGHDSYLRHAFVMCENSNKRSLDYAESDTSSKRQQV